MIHQVYIYIYIYIVGVKKQPLERLWQQKWLTQLVYKINGKSSTIRDLNSRLKYNKDQKDFCWYKDSFPKVHGIGLKAKNS